MSSPDTTPPAAPPAAAATGHTNLRLPGATRTSTLSANGAKGPWRLPKGGLVDRSKPVAFRFDGRSLSGFAGDTLASALMGAGVSLVGRSFKYHRPRGIATAGSEEPNALVELRSGARREPNTKATTVELYEGLDASSQNRWPSLGFDISAVNQLGGKMLGAGFYYKTFMWPASFWEKVYEPLIRRAAGLGRASRQPDPDSYERATIFCDVLVIGGGPTGLMAALAAGRSGARVILCDEDARLGGRLLADRVELDAMSGPEWVEQMRTALADCPEVRVMTRTAVFGAYDGGTYGAIERVSDDMPVPPTHQARQRYWRIVAKRTVLAAGAVERPIVFGGNDRPGVIAAGAVRAYVNRFGVAPGRRVAVFTNNDDGWRTAHDLAAAGVSVEAVIDPRAEVAPELLVGVARPVLGGRVTEVTGGRRVGGIKVSGGRGDGKIACDALAISGGWNPTVSLTCHLGGRPKWNDALAAFVPGATPPGMVVAGAANGTLTLAAGLAEGARAGIEAAQAAGFNAPAIELPRAEDEHFAVAPLWHVATSKKAFVDFQNDVTVDDVALSAREGFRSVEHLKRYTTLGMATDQGKTANINGLAILAELTGRSIPQTGTTTFRPPFVPVALGALGGFRPGHAYRPVRLPPSHGWAKEKGASFVETGPWLRAEWFPEAGERDWLVSVNREVQAVRTGVGFCDVSTLGKIDIQGPDAGRFLDRLYINTFSTLPVGRVRYGLMLREDGFVYDDGTTSRLGPDRWLMTTTTAAAVGVFQHMEYCRQVHWPDLDVQFVSATDQWAQFSVAGPRAREVIAAVVDPGVDVSDAAFPYMAAGIVPVMGGIQGRLYRISFSGERAYEIAVPARWGEALAARLADAGALPYGLEALNVMRVEKGHITHAEIDGRVTARDLGFAKMMSTKKDYIGRVMAQRPGLVDPERPALVGLKPVDKSVRIRSGGHFVAPGVEAKVGNAEGHVSSVAYSPDLGTWIGLGFLKRGPERYGARLRLVDQVRDTDILVEIVPPVFLDPAGERLRG